MSYSFIFSARPAPGGRYGRRRAGSGQKKLNVCILRERISQQAMAGKSHARHGTAHLRWKAPRVRTSHGTLGRTENNRSGQLRRYPDLVDKFVEMSKSSMYTPTRCAVNRAHQKREWVCVSLNPANRWCPHRKERSWRGNLPAMIPSGLSVPAGLVVSPSLYLQQCLRHFHCDVNNFLISEATRRVHDHLRKEE